jgi:hypothetical protein
MSFFKNLADKFDDLSVGGRKDEQQTQQAQQYGKLNSAAHLYNLKHIPSTLTRRQKCDGVYPLAHSVTLCLNSGFSSPKVNQRQTVNRSS